MPDDLLIHRPPPPAFTYNAKIISVYDGDTMTADIDLGFNIWMRGQKLRLYGVNTPELRGPEREQGLKVRDAVRNRLPVGRDVMLQSVRDRKGKYGRYLAIIWEIGDPMSINEWLLQTSRAKPYFP